MQVDWVVLIMAIISVLAGSTVLSAVIVGIFARKRNAAEAAAKIAEAKKSQADATKSMEDAMSGIVEHYKSAYVEVKDDYEVLKDNMGECLREIQALKSKLDRFEKRHADMLDVIERLVHQIKSRGDTPVCDLPEVMVGVE